MGAVTKKKHVIEKGPLALPQRQITETLSLDSKVLKGEKKEKKD